MSSETIALLAFRNPDGSLGFAQSGDPLTYGIRVERGESETRRVRAEATLEWMALMPSRGEAIAVRDRLNELGAEEAEAEMRRLALPSEAVETARRLIWAHVWEDGPEAAEEEDRDELAAAIAVALGGTTGNAGPARGKEGSGALECDWPQRLMIFDLDGTLADTSAFDGPGRRSHGGQLEKIRLYGGEGVLGTHDLARIAAPGRRVVVVTASPRGYAQDVLAHIGLEVDEIHAAAGTDKRAVFQRAMEEAECGPDETLVVGDRWPDWRAAAALGITSIGGSEFGASLPNQAPDVSFRFVEDLLGVTDPDTMGYIGECERPLEVGWHRGRVLKIGPSRWSLGRYFKKRDVQELGLVSLLSQDVLSAKSGAPPPRLAEAIRVVLARMASSEQMSVAQLASVPPKPGSVDRFVTPRRWAAEAFGLQDHGEGGRLVDRTPGLGGQKDKPHAARAAAMEDRYEWAGGSIRDAEVLLLDDVSTTGATLQAAELALKNAGAREVYSLVWGQTQAWYPPRGGR